jgi:hypothetical protein
VFKHFRCFHAVRRRSARGFKTKHRAYELHNRGDTCACMRVCAWEPTTTAQSPTVGHKAHKAYCQPQQRFCLNLRAVSSYILPTLAEADEDLNLGPAYKLLLSANQLLSPLLRSSPLPNPISVTSASVCCWCCQLTLHDTHTEIYPSLGSSRQQNKQHCETLAEWTVYIVLLAAGPVALLW